MKLQFPIAVAVWLSAIGTGHADGLKMQIDGKDWAATVINTTALPMGTQQVISISGKLEGQKVSVLSFQIAPATPDAPKGHYELKPGLPQKGGAAGIFNLDLTGGDPLEDSFFFQSGVLDITGYDLTAHALTGSFSGQLSSQSGTKTAVVKNGVLDMLKINP